MLIQFFHYPTLINRQRGGLYASYAPSSDDADCFRAMKTDLWFKFNRDASLPWTTTKAEVSEHFQQVQLYANRNPDETGTGNHLFSDEQREVIRKSGTPFTYFGYKILLLIGKDITYDGYLNNKAFIDGGSRTGHLTRDFLYRLVRSEAQAHSRTWNANSFDPRTSVWCFVDLWPWLWHRNLPRATEFLQNYMQIVKPLIAVSYGKNINAFTRASFQHQNGVRMDRFLTTVARPTIQFYEIDDATGVPDEESAFINIPHLHPGRDKYGPQDLRLRRVVDLTTQCTFLIGHTALQVIEEMSENDDGEAPTRKQLCELILSKVDALCKDSPAHKRFYENLQQARIDLTQYWGLAKASSTKSINPTAKWSSISADEDRPMLDADGCAKIASLGRAEGKPNSPERFQQLEQLWAQNMSDLHIYVPNEEGHWSEWSESMSSVQEDRYYYLHIIIQLTDDSYLTNILQNFRPSWIKGEQWLQDPKARQEAIEQAGRWVSGERQKDSSIEIVGERGPHAYLPPADCEGRAVKIFANGQFFVRWIQLDGEHTTTRLLSKLAIPKTTSRRYFRFTELGIDITDAAGAPFRAQIFAGKSESATISVKYFMHDPEIVQLWTEGCKAHGISTDALNDSDEDALEWGTKKGVKMLVGNAQSENRKQNRPPLNLDANWLLNEFLNSTDHLADGGTFRTALKEKFPDSTEDVDAFIDFIKQPEHIKHPYTADWRRYLDNNKPQIQVLAKNLPILRNSVTMNQQEKSKGLRLATKRASADSSKGVQVQERYFVLGAPGSALDDPFAEGSDQSCISADAKKKQKKKGRQLLNDDEEEDDEKEQEQVGSDVEGEVETRGGKKSKQKNKKTVSKRRKVVVQEPEEAEDAEMLEDDDE